MNQTIELLMNHVSIRKYDESKPVSAETVETIVQCAQMAPTSSHFQAYTIIRVSDTENKAKLAELAGGQKYVSQAPVVLLFCADLHRGAKYYEEVDVDIFANTESYTVAVIDAALAAQKALIAAQSMGLGGVVIGGIRSELGEVCKMFKLPDLVFPMFALCLGYPAQEPGIKPRLPMEAVFKQDFYDESYDEKLIEDYNDTVKTYYTERTKEKSKDRWTECCGKYLMAKPREEVGELLKKIGFLHR